MRPRHGLNLTLKLEPDLRLGKPLEADDLGLGPSAEFDRPLVQRDGLVRFGRRVDGAQARHGASGLDFGSPILPLGYIFVNRVRLSSSDIVMWRFPLRCYP